MIPGITEHTRIGEDLHNGLWLNADGSKLATLHQATIQLEEMGERTISTQVRIEGSVVPSFDGWELEWRGERFVLPTLKPQASKDNSTKNALVDLVFTSAPIHELKRYFFAEMTEIEVGTIIIDKYVATLRLSLTNFVAAFNRVLSYYFPDGSFVMNLNPSYQETGEVKEFPIDYMYIWDVLVKIHDIYDVTWKAVTNSQGVTVIRVGYDFGTIADHTFQYGFDGGLLRFERHVEDTDIYNVLLGRGGEKNLPYRYYKATDPYNTVWAADPDAIPELKSVYFSRLLDANFRWYIRGWVKNPNRSTSQDEGYTLPDYDDSDVPQKFLWAYRKGRYEDTKFDPVEYVKDDDSIALYGVRQGKLDDNDDIFPTIQGVWLDGLGRADEVVDVEVTAEDDPDAVFDIVTTLPDVYEDISSDDDVYRAHILSEDTFTIPDGRVGRMEYAIEGGFDLRVSGVIDTTNSLPLVVHSNGAEGYDVSAIPAGGPYKYGVYLRIRAAEETYLPTKIWGRFGIKDVSIHATPKIGLSYRQVFTIWVKNLWGTTQGNETDVQYAHRVWDPILGDKLGNSAAVCFSDGFLALSEDYEFLIQKLPEVDRTKSITTVDENGNTITVQSEWKITLVRSDAEYEATGLYIPNTITGGLPAAGDHFFFTGIDIPFQYVRWAEEKLTKTKEEALDDNAWTNPTWVVSLDKVRAHTLQEDDYGVTLSEQLDAGVLVKITDPRFTLNSRREQDTLTIGIRSVTFTWEEPSNGSPYIVPDIEVVLSDKIEHQRNYESVKGEVNYIQQNYTNVTQVKNIVKRTKSTTSFGIDGKINYLGPVIGTVEI